MIRMIKKGMISIWRIQMIVLNTKNLENELKTLGEQLPPAESLPAKRKEQSLDPTKRG